MKKFNNTTNLKKNNKAAKFLLPVFLTIILIFNCSFTLSVSAETANNNIIHNLETVTVFINENAKIDFTDSNTTGTVKINTVSKSDKKIRVTVTKNEENSATYTYTLKNDATIETYPLQMGDGEYIIKIWFNTSDIKYSLGLTGTYTVRLSDAYAPFLNPNQYVNYDKNSKIAKKAEELTKNCKTDLEKVEEIYKFVIHSLEYDTYKADTVKNDYLPAVDAIVDTGKGICFDYAAVFAAMLRSVNIPAKLVIGYVKPNNAYHAWNEFYLKDSGGRFKTNSMKFDGKKFERVDPTFESVGKTSKKVLEFIGDGTNYAKFLEY